MAVKHITNGYPNTIAVSYIVNPYIYPLSRPISFSIRVGLWLTNDTNVLLIKSTSQSAKATSPLLLSLFPTIKAQITLPILTRCFGNPAGTATFSTDMSIATRTERIPAGDFWTRPALYGYPLPILKASNSISLELQAMAWDLREAGHLQRLRAFSYSIQAKQLGRFLPQALSVGNGTLISRSVHPLQRRQLRQLPHLLPLPRRRRHLDAMSLLDRSRLG